MEWGDDMCKIIEKWGRFRKVTSFLCVFLAALLLVEMIPIAVWGESDRDIAQSEDISNDITWSDGKLEVETDGEWVVRDIVNISGFPSGDYQYTITWRADSQQSYQEGDYFTFSVPVEFSDVTLDLVAKDGTILGTVYIDEKGHGIATFTEKVEEMAEVSGVISFQGAYSESAEDMQVIWEFTFTNDIRYTYIGEKISDTDAEIQPDSEGADTDLKNESTTDLKEPEVPNGRDKVNNNGPTNVSDYIIWSGGVLKVKQGEDWVVIPHGDGGNVVFPATSEYSFDISWEAANGQSYQDGDYFTFTVPKEFGNMTLHALAADGKTELAEITIDEDGNGRVVFTSAIEGLNEIHGTISFRGQYWEQDPGEPVKWIFEFSDTITYEGTSAGYVPGTEWKIPTGLSKYGHYYENAYYWCIDLHLEADQLIDTDTVTVTDTFGGGYTIDMLENHDIETCNLTHNGICDWLDENSTFHRYYSADTEGYNEHGYFDIYAIDWDTLRDDYMEGGANLYKREYTQWKCGRCCGTLILNISIRLPLNQ